MEIGGHQHMTVISAKNLSLTFETNDSSPVGNRLPLVGRQEKPNAVLADPVGVTTPNGTPMLFKDQSTHNSGPGFKFRSAHNPHPQSLPTRGREVAISRTANTGDRQYLTQAPS